MTRKELEDLSRSELVALCKERNITIPKYARKSLLIDDILDYQDHKTVRGSFIRHPFPSLEYDMESGEYGAPCDPKRFGE